MRIGKYISKIIGMISILYFSQCTAYANDMRTNGFYFGIGLVQSNLATNQQTINNSFSTTNSSVLDNYGFGLELLAGYKADQHLSFEIGYTDIGEIISTTSASTEKLFTVDSVL